MPTPSPQRERISLPLRRSRSDALLASHDAGSLADHLARQGGSPSRARAAALRVLRWAFSGDAPPSWNDRSFAALGVGAWALPALKELDPSLSLAIAERAVAEDRTVRLALRARDGALLETVIIPGPARTTVCISSQVGCARACTFCETGKLGLARQLESGEMVDQVRLARSVWQKDGGQPALQNIVFMGMGEPFDNLAEVLRAIRLLTDPRAFGFAPSRITVSTVGVADKLEMFFRDTRAELAVSLNAPDNTRRGAIMPINTRFGLHELRTALVGSLPAGRRVLFEYVLFDGFNDAPEDADLVAAYAHGIRCRVNVIPCNPGPDPRLRPPPPERLAAFVQRLSSHGITTLVRRPRGREIGGACGQLAGAARGQPPAAIVR